MSRREIELLKKLKGGVCTNKKGEWICDGDLAMSKKEVEAMLKLLKAKKKKIVEAKKLGPDAFDRETGNLIKSCRRAGLHEMPNPNGVIMDLLQEGSLVEKVVEDKYWDTTRKEMVRCVNDTSLQAINRFLRNADNIGDVKATMDSKYEDLLTKIEMLEQNMELVKPFVTGHPEMGKMGAPLKLRKKGSSDDRTVKGIDGKQKEINTCAASTTRSSCEAKRHSLYGEAGEACLWMPNFNHLTEQALKWEKTSHKKTGKARTDERKAKEGTWKELQDQVCVPAEDFPFPMRPVTDADMEALRSGIAWKADEKRAMVKNMGKGRKDTFAPHMGNPMDKAAKYGYAEGDNVKTWAETFKSFIPLGQKADDKAAQKLSEKDRLYLPDPTASKRNRVSGRPLTMPYFFEKEGPMARHTPRAVERLKKVNYAKAATQVQRMFRAKRRALPKRVEAKYEAEFNKQKAFRDDARLRLQKQYNAQPTENEVEDLALQHPEARSRHALLQRLIYDVAVQGEWTEAEVYELLKADLTRPSGHVIIVSTEPGECKKAWQGIADNLDEDTAGKLMKNIKANESLAYKGTPYGKKAGKASLGEFFGVEDRTEYQNALAQRKADAQAAYDEANPGMLSKAASAVGEGLDVTRSILDDMGGVGSDDDEEEVEAKPEQSIQEEMEDKHYNYDPDEDGEYDGGILGAMANFFGEEYLVGGMRIPAPPADSPAASNVFTVLRGGGILPHGFFGPAGDEKNAKRDADTSDNWGLTQIFTSTLKDRKAEDKTSQENTCLHKIPETAAILMKANIALYMPMIHRFFKRQEQAMQDIRDRKTSEKRMDTAAVDPEQVDKETSLNMAYTNETDSQRFVREALFEFEKSDEDVMDVFRMGAIQPFKAKNGAGLSLRDLTDEEEKALSQNEKAMSAAIRGPSMTQRVTINKMETSVEYDGVNLDDGLPWPVWSSTTVLKKLAAQKMRGKAGKEGRSLLALFSTQADETLRGDGMDKYLEKWRKARAEHGKNWIRLYRVARDEKLFGSGSSPAKQASYDKTMDQIDAVRIILEGSLGAGSGATLSNDSLHQAVFRAYLRRKRVDYAI